MTQSHLNRAWELKLPTDEKFILVAIATHMGDAFSADTMSPVVADATGYSEEKIKSVIQDLFHRGILCESDFGSLTVYIPPKPTVKSYPYPKRREGYVYLVQSISGHYKIGRTQNPKNRLKTFNVKLPFEVECICLIKTHDTQELEKDLHNLFSHCRVNGEWFALSDKDVQYIKSLAEAE